MSDLRPLDPDAVVGCLLGQAVGDMMGLPAENLGPRRVAKLFPNFDRPRFLFGYGMGSDDTEHACMTAQALLRSGGDRHRFGGHWRGGCGGGSWQGRRASGGRLFSRVCDCGSACRRTGAG